MSVEIRTITDPEVVAFREALMHTFGGDHDDDPDGPARFRALIDRSQAWAAFDGGTVVGTAATFDLAIGIPGGTLPMAGLTMVTVRPTHRRRGILRELMRLHFDDARARGYAISGLWASEGTIYRRFDYGVAAESDMVEVQDANRLTVADGRELDALEWIDEARARELLPPIYARATADRPGALRRSEAWWRERRFVEASFMRGGASKRRHVVARRGGDAVGYVVYRQRGAHLGSEPPAGKAEINELIAIDARAEATLWKFALAMDLYPNVTWWNAPIDDTLAWIVSNHRHVSRRRVDTLWVRVDDVPGALAARRYAADGSVRIAIGDTTWQLAVDGGRATATATDRAAELRMDRAALGSLYLGGIGARLLARAGRIHGDDAAVAAADRLFAWPVAPWCPEVF